MILKSPIWIHGKKERKSNEEMSQQIKIYTKRRGVGGERKKDYINWENNFSSRPSMINEWGKVGEKVERQQVVFMEKKKAKVSRKPKILFPGSFSFCRYVNASRNWSLYNGLCTTISFFFFFFIYFPVMGLHTKRIMVQ